VTVAPSPPPRLNPGPSLLTEGIVLALSTAAAYAIAFAFESGYADCYGYPSWLVEVSSASVVLSLTTIASALLFIAFLFVFTTGFLPARAVRLLVFNRFTAMIAAGIAILFQAHHVLYEDDSLWLGIPVLIFGGLALALGALRWVWLYRETDPGQPFLARIETANKWAWDQDSKAAPVVKDTVLDRTLKNWFTGNLLVWVILLCLVTVFGSGIARAYGGFRARGQYSFLVSSDPKPLVALRRYNDHILASPLERVSSGVSRPILVLPWENTDRVWSYRHLPRDSSSFAGCR